MTRLDLAVLDVPAGSAPVEGVADTTAADPNGPACQMAKLSYKTSLGTKLAFTALVFAVSLAAAAALVYAIIKLIKDGADLSAVVTGVSGVVASGGVVFLVKRMNEASAAEQRALNKVRQFCGTEVAGQL
jgi:hypothetical protein